jgi:hypothetical protein
MSLFRGQVTLALSDIYLRHSTYQCDEKSAPGQRQRTHCDGEQRQRQQQQQQQPAAEQQAVREQLGCRPGVNNIKTFFFPSSLLSLGFKPNKLERLLPSGLTTGACPGGCGFACKQLTRSNIATYLVPVYYTKNKYRHFCHLGSNQIS